MNADKRRYNAANLRSSAFICGSNSPIYLAKDHKLILICYSQVSPYFLHRIDFLYKAAVVNNFLYDSLA